MTNSERAGNDSNHVGVEPRRTFSNLLSELWHQKPGARVPKSPAAPITTKEIVNGLDQREKLFGWVLTALAVGLALLAYFVNASSTTIANRNAAVDFLITMLIGAFLLGLGIVLKRRALLGFAAFLFGLEQVTFRFIYGALLYLAFGGWLIYRVMQKNKADRAAGIVRSPGRTSSTNTASNTPRPSKRYTPPKTTRRKP